MTRRERLEAKVERRRDWADKRRAKAAGVATESERYHGDHAFNTQPGHIPERARLIAREERAFEDLKVADHHESRASGLERQLDRSVFSDDVDAIEQLQARIDENVVRRDRMKLVNKLYRKNDVAGLAELGMSLDKMRSIVDAPGNWHKVPHPAYELTNLGARIRSDEKRIEEVKRRQVRAERATAAGGVLIEGVGDYVSITFDEKPDRAVLNDLHAADFHWGAGSWSGYRSKLPASVLALVAPPVTP